MNCFIIILVPKLFGSILWFEKNILIVSLLCVDSIV